jgi:hypothetical protein
MDYMRWQCGVPIECVFMDFNGGQYRLRFCDGLRLSCSSVVWFRKKEFENNIEHINKNINVNLATKNKNKKHVLTNK